MYAQMIKFKLKDVSKEEVKAGVSRMLASHKSAKGFVSAIVYFDEETNEWNRITVWKTKEDWIAYGDSVRTSESHNKDMKAVDGGLARKEYEVIGYVTAD